MVLDFVGFNAVKMLFYSAVLSGVLAPPLVAGSTADKQARSNGHASQFTPVALGWATAAIMTAAAVGMFATM